MGAANWWVCRGPEFGTDWCVVDTPDTACVAPGGVVLCHQGTKHPHPAAREAAAAAWEVLNRWRTGL